MNDAITLDDRETATAGRRPMPGDSAGKQPAPFRGMRTLPVILLMLAFTPMAACSGTSEERAYDIADRHAVWRDKFTADRRACARRGGVIVQERYRSRSIRIGDAEPEVGAHYYCRY